MFLNITFLHDKSDSFLQIKIYCQSRLKQFSYHKISFGLYFWNVVHICVYFLPCKIKLPGKIAISFWQYLPSVREILTICCKDWILYTNSNYLKLFHKSKILSISADRLRKYNIDHKTKFFLFILNIMIWVPEIEIDGTSLAHKFITLATRFVCRLSPNLFLGFPYKWFPGQFNWKKWNLVSKYKHAIYGEYFMAYKSHLPFANI